MVMTVQLQIKLTSYSDDTVFRNGPIHSSSHAEQSLFFLKHFIVFFQSIQPYLDASQAFQSQWSIQQ